MPCLILKYWLDNPKFISCLLFWTQYLNRLFLDSLFECYALNWDSTWPTFQSFHHSTSEEFNMLHSKEMDWGILLFYSWNCRCYLVNLMPETRSLHLLFPQFWHSESVQRSLHLWRISRSKSRLQCASCQLIHQLWHKSNRHRLVSLEFFLIAMAMYLSNAAA